MAEDPNKARRVALARSIGAQMSAAVKRRKAGEASANFYRQQGFAAEANKAAGQAQANFKDTKSKLVALVDKEYKK